MASMSEEKKTNIQRILNQPPSPLQSSVHDFFSKINKQALQDSTISLIKDFCPSEQDEENYQYHHQNMNFYEPSRSIEFNLFAELDLEDFENISDSSFIIGRVMADKPSA